RGRRGRGRPAPAAPPRSSPRCGKLARPSPRGAAVGAPDDRPRPPPLRLGTARRAGFDRPAPAPPRTSVRARAAGRARPGARSAWKRRGLGLARATTIVLVSHLDELDDFEAELELRLKKEYSAVYSLFRYCVLTQDATYLCNRLDLQYVPQPSYPFFQLKMEDVWVWDKNRPTRMIPRVEVYTSAD